MFPSEDFGFIYLPPLLNLITLYFEYIWACISVKAKIKFEIFKVKIGQENISTHSFVGD